MAISDTLAARLRELGNGFNLPEVQKLYEPLLAEQPRDGVELDADLAYDEHARHRLDVYRPTSADTGLRPVLVFVHGRGFVRGDKTHKANVGWCFAREGFVTVLPNYRLAPESRWPSGAQDVAAVVSWLQEHAARFPLLISFAERDLAADAGAGRRAIFEAGRRPWLHARAAGRARPQPLFADRRHQHR